MNTYTVRIIADNRETLSHLLWDILEKVIFPAEKVGFNIPTLSEKYYDNRVCKTFTVSSNHDITDLMETINTVYGDSTIVRKDN